MAVIKLFRQSFRFDNDFFTAFLFFVYLLKFRALIDGLIFIENELEKKWSNVVKSGKKSVIFVP